MNTHTHAAICACQGCGKFKIPAVVVVDRHGRVIVGKDKISVDGVPNFAHGRAAVMRVVQVYLAVPAVETRMIAAFPTN